MMILQTIFSIASSCCINDGDSNKLGLNDYHGLPKLVANLAGKLCFPGMSLFNMRFTRIYLFPWCLNDWMHYVGIGNSELTILTDFDAPIEVQQYVFGELNDRGILHSTHSIETLRSV